MVCEKCNGKGMIEDINGIGTTCSCYKPEMPMPVDKSTAKVFPKTEHSKVSKNKSKK